MHRVFRIALAVGLVMSCTLAFGVRGAAAATPQSSTSLASTITGRQSVDVATCATFISSLKSGASQLSPGAQAALPSLKPTDCVMVSLETTTRAPSTASAAAAATSGCGSFDKSLAFMTGPITILTLRVNVGMCWNGSTAWTNWGPNCYMYALPIYGTDITWCGVWRSGYYETNPGLNGDLYNYPAPWWKIGYPWMRYQVWGDGSSGPVWGGK